MRGGRPDSSRQGTGPFVQGNQGRRGHVDPQATPARGLHRSFTRRLFPRPIERDRGVDQVRHGSHLLPRCNGPNPSSSRRISLSEACVWLSASSGRLINLTLARAIFFFWIAYLLPTRLGKWFRVPKALGLRARRFSDEERGRYHILSRLSTPTPRRRVRLQRGLLLLGCGLLIRAAVLAAAR